jgi:hypothetical protein
MTTNYSPEQVTAIASRHLDCPEHLPRAWSEMSPSEQAMTAWFVRRRDHFTRSSVAYHILACACKAKGDHLTAAEADTLWELIFPKE